MWDLPGPGLEPVSPALAGGFLTTAPRGKSLSIGFDIVCVRVSWTYILYTVIILVRDPHPRMVDGNISENSNPDVIPDVDIISRLVAQIFAQYQTLANYQPVCKWVVC